MGVSTNLYLPPTVRVKDFADMLAKALGAPAHKRPFQQYGDGWSTHVDHDLKISTHETIPSMLTIHGFVPDPAGGDPFSVYGTWHWETSYGFHPIRGGRLFSTGSYEERFPVFDRLAWLFRGVVDLNDCDDEQLDIDYRGYSRAYRPDAEDDEAWYAWQKAMYRFKGPERPEWNGSR